MTAAAEQPETLVLVADDDEDIRALVSLRLQRSGYEVVAARDGEEAFRLACERRPDVAVLDVGMPRLTGFEVTARLREHAGTRDLPVILLTARAQESDVARGYEAGADAYISKPFNPQELRDSVRALLEEK